MQKRSKMWRSRSSVVRRPVIFLQRGVDLLQIGEHKLFGHRFALAEPHVGARTQ